MSTISLTRGTREPIEEDRLAFETQELLAHLIELTKLTNLYLSISIGEVLTLEDLEDE